MQLPFRFFPTAQRAGYALPLALVLTGVSLAVFASMAGWTASNSAMNDRNNTYNSTVAAAEAASENVLSYLARDFVNQSYNPGNLAVYRGLVPTNAWATRYRFTDGAGGDSRSWVTGSSTMVVTNLDSQFEGLYGLVYQLALRSQASPLDTPYDLAAAVEQDLQLASIPVFQFMIFYGMDLEINPGPAMQITGKVFGNANIYTAPVTSLEYCDDVMAVQRIFNNRAPCDPTSSGKVRPVYDAQHVENVSSLTLPIGTNNSPAAIRAILEVPPAGESPSSLMGRQRYFNKVDLLIVTTRTNVQVRSGQWNYFTSVSPDTTNRTRFSFVETNATFYDQRENKYTVTTDLDVGDFRQWLTNGGAALNSAALLALGHAINSVYVYDLRTVAGKLTVVRVNNGRQLPPAGLTVATPQPLYVQGHFNAPNITPGSTDTTHTLPASLLGDAITVLSANWSDGNSTKTLANRPAKDTTVNAAFLAGIVPTTCAAGGHYSGGVENFPRFLESWSSKTFTYNGSMVVFFPSQFATNFWIDPGTYYNAPTRQWAFDTNFREYNRLPPATPQVRKIVRGQWKVVAAH